MLHALARGFARVLLGPFVGLGDLLSEVGRECRVARDDALDRLPDVEDLGVGAREQAGRHVDRVHGSVGAVETDEQGGACLR